MESMAYMKWVETQAPQIADGATYTVVANTETGLVVVRSPYTKQSNRFGPMHFPEAVFTFPGRSKKV